MGNVNLEDETGIAKNGKIYRSLSPIRLSTSETRFTLRNTVFFSALFYWFSASLTILLAFYPHKYNDGDHFPPSIEWIPTKLYTPNYVGEGKYSQQMRLYKTL